MGVGQFILHNVQYEAEKEESSGNEGWTAGSGGWGELNGSDVCIPPAMLCVAEWCAARIHILLSVPWRMREWHDFAVCCVDSHARFCISHRRIRRMYNSPILQHGRWSLLLNDVRCPERAMSIEQHHSTARQLHPSIACSLKTMDTTDTEIHSSLFDIPFHSSSIQ